MSVSARLGQSTALMGLDPAQVPYAGTDLPGLLRQVKEAIDQVAIPPFPPSLNPAQARAIRAVGAHEPLFAPDRREADDAGSGLLADRLLDWLSSEPYAAERPTKFYRQPPESAFQAQQGGGSTMPTAALPGRPAGLGAAHDGAASSLSVLSLSENLVGVEIGCLSGLDPETAVKRLDDARRRSALVRELGQETDDRATPLFAMIGTGLDAPGQRDLMGEAYYLEVPESYWGLDPAGRRNLVRSFLVDPNEFLPDEPAELASTGSTPSTPDADRAVYATMPFETDPEAVADWTRHISLPLRAKDKAD
ncbi:hypothetical protein [Methylobacterium durans]|uniref:Uncharacterized protein n=1 Tax=Methylobacterium durans TaxID=2202825 RepID=A0A2U8W8T5_9HYPH|nr:hypothetical protein [Methylobacterium durans]AWN42545.1 hypothetical protein DK389_21115 [Methylobacterium durans]